LFSKKLQTEESSTAAANPLTYSTSNTNNTLAAELSSDLFQSSDLDLVLARKKKELLLEKFGAQPVRED
jgi:hypothetical protein